ncbi:MAG TPA: hypothetical protein P5107_06745 [Thermotogota bacterium]|nr:hypothetical protein [Thermotogota bacterium]
MFIKKIGLQLLFVFGFIFGLTVLIIFLYNYLMSGMITLQWKIPLRFPGFSSCLIYSNTSRIKKRKMMIPIKKNN